MSTSLKEKQTIEMYCAAPDSLLETLALYKSLTYVLTYLLT